MSKDKESGSRGQRDTESMNSGEMGERNRNTPGRSVTELGLDRTEARGQNVLGAAGVRNDAIPGVSDDAATRSGNLAGSGDVGAVRRNPPLTEDAGVGEGGVSQSGGRAGGERGHAGTSDRGAGGPLGDMRAGAAQHKSTSRGDLDHGAENTDKPSRGG